MLTACTLPDKQLLTSAEVHAATGLDPEFLRDNSRADGTGEVPGRRIGRMWVYPRWWVAWLLLPPAAWLPALAALWASCTAAPFPAEQLAATGTAS